MRLVSHQICSYKFAVILSLYCIWSLKLDVLCIRHAVYFGYIFQNNNTMSIYQWPIDTFVKNVFTEWFLWFIHISSSYSINDLISIILSSLNRGVESLQSQPWLCSSVVPLRNRVVTVTVTWLYNFTIQRGKNARNKIIDTIWWRNAPKLYNGTSD